MDAAPLCLDRGIWHGRKIPGHPWLPRAAPGPVLGCPAQGVPTLRWVKRGGEVGEDGWLKPAAESEKFSLAGEAAA